MTVALTTGQKVLVHIYTSCENTNAGKGCFMSLVASGAVTQAAGDNNVSITTDAGVAGMAYGGSATFLYTATATGNATFTA